MITHRIHIIFTLLVFIATIGPLRGQDPIYSQFYNAPLQLNPAFAGNSTTPLLAMNYRNQWPTWGPRAYSTASISFNQFFEDMNSGFGVTINTDNAGAGILKTNRISGVYAYRLKFRNNLQAKFGMEASFTQNRLDWDKLIFLDQIDLGEFGNGGAQLPTAENRPNDLSQNYFDMSFGVLAFSPKFYAGLTLKHLNAPNNKFLEDPANKFTGIPMRLSVHAGYTIDLDKGNNDGFGTFLAPSIMIVSQSDFSQINAGALFNRESFFGGAWLRYTFSNVDAVILSFGWRTDLFKLSYSFDLTVSGASVLNTAGSHELGFVYNFGADKSRTDYNDCFKIFR